MPFQYTHVYITKFYSTFKAEFFSEESIVTKTNNLIYSVDYKLQDLVDLNLFQTVIDRLNQIHPFPSKITDDHGNVLIASAWQDVCTRFRRHHPESVKVCSLGDRYIAEHLDEANPSLICHCLHGMVTCATPIIIEGNHLGTLHIGQVFLEKPNREYFQKQASRHNFDERAYLEAIEAVPVWEKSELDKYMATVNSMVEILVENGTRKLSEIKFRQIIQENEKRFKYFFEDAPDAIILTEMESRIVIDANRAASRLLGRPIEDIIGMHQSELHPPGAEQVYMDLFYDQPEEEEEVVNIRPIESTIIRADGTKVPVEVLSAVLKISGRTVFQGIFRDIGFRLQIESELSASERKYRLLTENLPDIIARYDKDLKHVYINAAIEEVAGLPVAAFWGKTNEDLQMPAENVKCWNENLRWVFENRQQRTIEFTYHTKSAKRFFSALLVPEFDPEGKVNSVLSVARDITSLKKSEFNIGIQHQISVMLSQATELNQGLSRLLELVCQLDGVDCGAIYLVDQFSGSINLVAHLGLSSQFVNQTSHYSPDSVNAAIVRTGDAFFMAYSDIKKRNIAPVIQEKIRSLSIFPIKHNGVSIACLNIGSLLYDEISPETWMFFKSVATHLGGTISRLQAENFVKENEKKYRLLFENITQAFASHQVILNEEGVPVDYRYLSVNPTFEKILGVKAKDVIGKTVLEISPQTEKYWIETFGQVAITGEPVQYENYAGVAGKYFEVWAFCPRIGEFATVFSDITERKRDEKIRKVMYAISTGTATSESLEELIVLIRDQLGELINVTNFYIALYDEEADSFSIPFYSDQKDTITYFPAGKTMTSYVMKRKKTLFCKRKDIDALIRSGEVESLGEPAVAWLGVPLEIKGKPIGAFVLQSYEDENAFSQDDVSMLEFVSRQICTSIQQKMDEREIKAALEKAEESNRLKSSFLANMSHELRTPMNGILGFSELLDDEFLTNEERREYINVIVDSGRSLLDVITNIVDLSKIESCQLESKMKLFNLNELLEEEKARFLKENRLKDKPQLTIELKKSLPDEQSIILSDQTKISQTISLLLNNAAKFTTKGYIHFGYIVQGNTILFFVKDTGKGITPEKQSTIFERFRQEDETLARKYGGVGLGLSIAKGLVEMLEGKIWVESEPEKGSTFWFEIPVKQTGN